MIELFLDTSIKYITISIIKNGEQIYLLHEKIFEDLSIKILPLLDDALKKCSLKINDIDRIYVVDGPGSFTGIRIGLTIIKVLAWTLKKQVIPISSLELIATTETKTDYVIPCIDARRGNCFLGIYDKDLNIIEKDQFVDFNQFISNIDKDKSFKVVTYDDLDYNDYIFPKINVNKIISKHKNDIPINPHLLNPNYLKKTEAEENLNKKNDKENYSI